ncbi:MAG: hypothetical protein KGJ55_03350 [Gammaproteobacteria bacterium]|nr:hypothetical protein [Gammaproteobacteria bacterium]
MNREQKLPLALLVLRVGIFIMFIFWVFDKFVRPEHASAVGQHFFGLGALGKGSVYAIGAIELSVLLAFLAGLFKTYTYGLVLLFHLASTLASFPIYLAPYHEANILFFAAWPTLAACFALFYLRDHDTLLTIGRRAAA